MTTVPPILPAAHPPDRRRRRAHDRRLQLDRDQYHHWRDNSPDDTNNGGATNTVGIEVTDNLGKKHNYVGHVTIVKPTIGVEVYGEATFTDDTITTMTSA